MSHRYLPLPDIGSDFSRLSVPMTLSDTSHLIAYTSHQSNGNTVFSVYNRSTPLPGSDFERSAVMSFIFDKENDILRAIHYPEHSNSTADTVEAGFLLAEKAINRWEKESHGIRSDLERAKSDDLGSIQAIAALANELWNSRVQIPEGQKFTKKRGDPAKNVQKAFSICFESFMESSKTDPDTGTISLLKYLNGLAKRNLEKAKSQLLQSIWEVKKDIWELEQLRDTMSYLVPRTLKCMAERYRPSQSNSS